MSSDSDRRALELRFHEAMVDIYARAKKEAKYNATYFIQMVSNEGGLATARYLIHKENVTDGYTALYELGRLDLTVEAEILRPEWRPLFTDEERTIAEQRLRDYGFDVEGYRRRIGVDGEDRPA